MAGAEAIPGVVVGELVRHEDERGSLMETWRADRFAGMAFVQDNLSSSRGGVVRGLHYQVTRPQGKLVYVVRGAVFDVVVDLRRDSPAFRRWWGVELSAENRRQLWIPPGCAHGFQAVSEMADVAYKLTAAYDPADERAIRWDDPELAIAWPRPADVRVSARDAAAPWLRDAELPRFGARSGDR
jgi:dTDP-4-dehydrorhamnose 3,5-epimerase